MTAPEQTVPPVVGAVMLQIGDAVFGLLAPGVDFNELLWSHQSQPFARRLP